MLQCDFSKSNIFFRRKRLIVKPFPYLHLVCFFFLKFATLLWISFIILEVKHYFVLQSSLLFTVYQIVCHFYLPLDYLIHSYGFKYYLYVTSQISSHLQIHTQSLVWHLHLDVWYAFQTWDIQNTILDSLYPYISYLSHHPLQWTHLFYVCSYFSLFTLIFMTFIK